LFVSTGTAIQAVRLTPRHRVELTSGQVAAGLDFGDRLMTFQAVASTPADQAWLATAPTQLRLDLNDAVAPASLQAGDLTIGESPRRA